MSSAAVCHAHIRLFEMILLMKVSQQMQSDLNTPETLALETFISHQGSEKKKTVRADDWQTLSCFLERFVDISHRSVLSNSTTMADKMVQWNIKETQYGSEPTHFRTIVVFNCSRWLFFKSKSCQWRPLISDQVCCCRDKPWECADCLCCQRRI